MALVDDVNRIFREFRRYTGDGLPEAPTNANLPVGDPSSGPHNPKKADIRLLLANLAAGVGGTVSAALGVMASKADAQALSLDYTPLVIQLAGYYEAGDGGGAFYADPTTVDPGTTDSLQILVNGVPTYYRRVHIGAVDLLAHGLKGDGTNETTLFLEAVALAQSLGLNKIICSDPTRTFKVVEAEIAADIEIDLGGASLIGDFGAWGTSTVDGTPIHWTKNILFSTAANAPSVTLKNMTINGMNDPNLQMIGGTPAIDFRGGASPGDVRVRFENVIFTRGANRRYTTGSGISVPTAVLDYRNAEILIYNVDRFDWIGGELRSSPGEILVVQSDDARTKFNIEGGYFTKRRDQNPAAKWSSSAICIFNCHPHSRLINNVFDGFVKGPINVETDGVRIEDNHFIEVDDSSGLDLCEARSFRQNQFIIRNNYFEDIPVCGIRAAASNLLIEGNSFLRVNIAVSIEGAIVGDPARGAWVKTTQTALHNILIRHNNLLGFSGSHVDLIGVRSLGASATLQNHITVEGSSLQDRPIGSKPLYAVDIEHTELVLRGYHGEGRLAVIRATGTCRLVAEDCQFAPEEAEGAHVFHLNSATLSKKGLIVNRCKRTTNLAAGHYDIRSDAGTIDLDAIHVNSSPGFPATTNNAVIARDGVLVATATFDPGSVANGAQTTTTVSVPGARTGDKAEAFINTTQAGMKIDAYVSASNVVTVVYSNSSGAAIDLPSHTITAHVRKT